MFKNILKKTLGLLLLTVALLLHGNPQAQASSLQLFKFFFPFSADSALKGIAKGELQTDSNTVTNLSDFWAVYYNNTLPPIVFDTLDLDFNPTPQFTLNGDPLVSFGGTNSDGAKFSLFNDGVNSSAIVTNSGGNIVDSAPNLNGFDSQNVIYSFLITAQLPKDTTTVPGVGFPDIGNVEGYIFFPNNVDSLKQPNPDFLPLPAVDYPINDFIFAFSDENNNPRFALIPNGQQSTFTAINPANPNIKGKTAPTNPETFELVLYWDIGYNNPNDTNEVLTTCAGNESFLPSFQGDNSRLVFFDGLNNPEAIYQANRGTLESATSCQVPEPSNVMGLASLLGLTFFLKKSKK